MPKFCANLNFLYPEAPFLDRYKLAKEAGFKMVETGFPSGFTKIQVTEAKNNAEIQQVLINVDTGDVTKGELGFAALLNQEEKFQKSLQTTIEFAKALGAKKIHIMSGNVKEVTVSNDKVYEKNLKYAAGLLEQENILGLIEPISKFSLPNYYMNSYDKAMYFIKKIDSPNLKLMLDIFHLQQINGKITETIKSLITYIGHVQIAQVPNRNEPNTPGELNYIYILEVLAKSGYNDWIGLEYKPKGDLKSGLNWIQQYGYSL